jgi:hypothetical protein
VLPPDERCVRRHAGGRPKKSEKRGNDGWIAALAHWAAATYHWGFEEIMWAVPLSAICLLRRQTQRDKSGNMTVFPLSEIEKIDDGEETHS